MYLYNFDEGKKIKKPPHTHTKLENKEKFFLKVNKYAVVTHAALSCSFLQWMFITNYSSLFISC